ncbi:MAG: NADAR family protein [Rhizobacter sp.]
MTAQSTHNTAILSKEQLLSAIAFGFSPKYLFFWGHRPSKDGSINKSCFSQWFDAAFILDGERYATAEHFMMAEKARLFGDEETRRQVLAASTPAEAKKLGRGVQNFSDALWLAKRFEIVVSANQAKFMQNPAMAQFLVRTGAQVLVEASPVDNIWGIGIAADHPDALHPARWQGLNLLGFALMQVRETFLS